MLRAFLFIVSAGTLLCQELDLGVQGGVPFGDFFSPGRFQGPLGNVDYTSMPVPYTIGPTVQAGLPYRLRLEGSALYQRFHFTLKSLLIVMIAAMDDLYRHCALHAFVIGEIDF